MRYVSLMWNLIYMARGYVMSRRSLQFQGIFENCMISLHEVTGKHFYMLSITDVPKGEMARTAEKFVALSLHSIQQQTLVSLDNLSTIENIFIP
jgi:hypothetical protein